MNQQIPDPLYIEPRKLREVNLAMRSLHKSLIEVVRRDYERLHGEVKGPFALLTLLMSEPFFAWLRPMSRVMVEMDELLELEPIEEIRMAGLRDQIEGMISTEKYLAMLHASPEIVISHTALRQALGNLLQVGESRG